MSTKHAWVLGVLAAASAAPAQGQRLRLQVSEEFEFVRPLAAARIDADGRLLTPFLPLPDGTATGSPCSRLLYFDCFEPDGGVPGRPTDGGYGWNCGLGGLRYYWGETGGQVWGNPFVTNDFTIVDAGCEGARSTRLAFGFYLGRCDIPPVNPHAIIQIWETFNECRAPDREGFVSGLILKLPPLSCGARPYYVDAHTLCETGLDLTMPADGSGAYDIFIGRDFVDRDGDGTPETLILAESAQPGLWGADGVKHLNPSSQGIYQYDDRTPSEGVHDPRPGQEGGDCWPYDLDLCPTPLGAMICFYGDELAGPNGGGGFVPLTGEIIPCRGACDPCDANCDGTVNAVDIEPFLEILFGGGDRCAECTGDVNNDGLVNAGDIEGFIACLFR